MSEVSSLHLSKERWSRLEGLFHAAAELHGEEREAFIRRETASDGDLDRELRAMLRHADGASDRIAETIARIAGRAAEGSGWVGRRLGPYRIVREIGRGGMGLVFEAVRDDAEYQKTVALKVAPEWRDLDRLRERFRNERQILARLEHPHIARFLDGGTDHGIPYFAMEYIDGKPVTEWARERALGIRERIELFRQICGAVAYAHENLVIHRDLKPANILVDRNNTPKLLDFGIATLLSPIAEEPAATTGVRLWTPDYTSPEQVRGHAVTVRADVYSLGLVLYELLCGERAQVADASSPLALDRSICEIEPVPPSVRAAARGETHLGRQLEGDLDTIVAAAIRKEPERRYSSAAALDADLARFLDGRAVEARPNTARYRFSKFIRRHRLASVTVTIVAISVFGGLASTLYQARRAERRFEQVRSLANSFIFEVHDRIQYLPGATEARQAIVSTALRYLESLRQDAGNDPALLRELAAAYEKIGDVQGEPTGSNLGDSKGALASYRRAESLLAPLARRGDPDARFAHTSVVFNLSKVQRALGDPAGVALLEEAHRLARELVAHQGNDIKVLGLAGNIEADRARLSSNTHAPRQAREAAQEATDIAQRMVRLQPNSMESLDFLALSQTSLATAYRASGDLERSAQTYREALKIREQLVREHPEIANYRRLLLLNYGHLGDALGPPELNGLGDLPGAEEAYQKAAAIAEWIYQHDPEDRKSWFDLVAARMRAASILLEEPRGALDSLQILEREEPLLSKLVKEDPDNQRYRLYAFTLSYSIGKALAAVARDTEAVQRLERTRAEARSFQGGPNEASASSAWINATVRLGLLQAKHGDPRALAMANEAAAALTNAGPKALGNAWAQASFYARLGSLYQRAKQEKAAAGWFEKSAGIWRQAAVPAALEAQRRQALADVESKLENR